jgi:hypothetical protein
MDDAGSQCPLLYNPSTGVQWGCFYMIFPQIKGPNEAHVFLPVLETGFFPSQEQFLWLNEARYAGLEKAPVTIAGGCGSDVTQAVSINVSHETTLVSPIVRRVL